MIRSACSSSSVNTSAWSRLANHQTFSRRTCSCAVAVKRTRRFLNAIEVREGSRPRRQTTGRDVFVRILKGLMERGPILLIEPVPGVERQEFDFGSFGQIGWLVDDESSSLHSSLQRHATTVASRHCHLYVHNELLPNQLRAPRLISRRCPRLVDRCIISMPRFARAA